MDVRLGNYFIISKKTEYPAFDISKSHDVRKFQEKVFIPLGQSLYLLPKTFALGVTLEYLRLPRCLCCEVVTRSTWGRLGLIIATAVWVHPMFTGCLTLELVNAGDLPIALFPGMKVGTLVFHTVEGDVETGHKGVRKYMGSVLPEFSHVKSESEQLARLKEIGIKFYPAKK